MFQKADFKPFRRPVESVRALYALMTKAISEHNGVVDRNAIKQLTAQEKSTRDEYRTALAPETLGALKPFETLFDFMQQEINKNQGVVDQNLMNRLEEEQKRLGETFEGIFDSVPIETESLFNLMIKAVRENQKIVDQESINKLFEREKLHGETSRGVLFNFIGSILWAFEKGKKGKFLW